MNSMNIKKDDKVIVLSGKDKGKTAKVLGTIPGQSKVVVEGVNMATCHIKPKKQGEEGGIVKREQALYASKVQVVCPKCDKPTRIGHSVKDGKKIRVCKHCGAEL
jgi:large subunit ribosomal protein L24